MGEFSLTAIVRPFGLGDGARPKRTATIPPPVAAEQVDRGLVTIGGGSGQVITLNHSHSVNASRSVKKEVERTYDEVRVKNPDAPNQHVDVQRPTRITVSPTSVGVHSGSAEITIYAPQPQQDNVEVLSTGNRARNPNYP